MYEQNLRIFQHFESSSLPGELRQAYFQQRREYKKLIKNKRQSFLNSRRGHSFKLMKHHTNKSVRSHFFSERVINNWNSLPEDVVAAQSINAFWHWNRLDWH